MKKILPFFLFLFISAISSRGATFNSTATGAYNNPAIWSVVGFDADGIPDLDDNVIINAGHTVKLTATAYAKTLTTNPGGTINLNTRYFGVFGNLTNNGSSIGSGFWYFRAPGTYSGNPINNSGNIYFYTNYTIAAGVNVNKYGPIYISANATVTNNGNIILNSSGYLNLASNAKWINTAGSSMTVSRPITNNGTIDCSAASNTFTYIGNSYILVVGTNATYYNLVLNANSSATKILSGTLNVLNDFTINNFVNLNCNNQNINVGGNWTNNSNFTCTNMATVTFNGTGTQNISRTAAEQFKNVVLSGSGTVKLLKDVIINGTTTINSGTLDPNTFVYHQRGASWVSNGGSINPGATGSVTFDGGINQTIGGTASTTFGNLEINDNAGFSVTCLLDESAAGTTTLTSGTLDPGAFTFHQTGASWLANGGNLNVASSGTIAFEGAAPQTIGGTIGSVFGKILINASSTVSLALDLNVVTSITIQAGTLDVSASNFTINLKGNFIHSGGSFTAQNGNIHLTGFGVQTFSGAASTNFYDIISDNFAGGVSVTGAMVVSNILKVNAQTFGTSGAGTITMNATGATTYGRIAALGAGASLVGSGWSVKSYIDGPATAYWQYLGSPISGNVLSDWDNDARFYMSGTGGNDGNACCPIFRSVRIYNEPTNTYTNITTQATALTAGKGFMVWMADNLSSLTAPLVYDSKGIPNQGTINRAVTAGGAGGGYNLISNPYACPITYATVVTASGNLGPNFLILQENGSYVTSPNGGIIAPNQGFLCLATSGGSVSFTEAAKNTGVNPNIIRSANPENFLTITSGNGTNGLGGSTIIQILPDAHNGKDINFDMPYIPSPYDDATNIWTTDKDGYSLLLNALDGYSDEINIPLTVKSGTPGSQLLSFKGLNGFSAYSCAWLEDIATGEKINLKNHDTYSFNADAVGENHLFNLHFERDGNCPLDEQQITPSLDANSQVFVNNNNILVKFGFEEKTDVIVTVFNLDGQEVFAPTGYAVGSETIALYSPLAHGIYLVKIAQGNEIITKKIYY
ncbi:hypothetical protein BH09BAC5_BH09BAC5_08040 [soil metagenome]